MNDLALAGVHSFLSNDHRAIAQDVVAWLPVANLASRPFGKTQSQFMDHVMTVSHPTPLRNLRQILAEVQRCEAALRENYFRLRKADVLLRKAREALAACDHGTDSLDRELLAIDVDEKAAGLAASRLYVEGCIRQIAGYKAQYEAISRSCGYDSFSELDFERQEACYHVMKAFEQALCAARARDGLIDEGNHIYLFQLGINGAEAQAAVDKLIADERKAIAGGEGIPPQWVWSWLHELAEKYADRAAWMRRNRGMIDGPVLTATVP